MNARPSTPAIRAAEAALIQAWPDLGDDPVYVNQLVQHALDSALPVALADDREQLALAIEAQDGEADSPNAYGCLLLAARIVRAGGVRCCPAHDERERLTP